MPKLPEFLHYFKDKYNTANIILCKETIFATTRNSFFKKTFPHIPTERIRFSHEYNYLYKQNECEQFEIMIKSICEHSKNVDILAYGDLTFLLSDSEKINALEGFFNLHGYNPYFVLTFEDKKRDMDEEMRSKTIFNKIKKKIELIERNEKVAVIKTTSDLNGFFSKTS